jgi:hypothetical protein
MASKWGAKNGLPGYDSFRCGLSYQQAFEMLKDNHADSKLWKYKRRGTVLGFMHQWKLEQYHRAVEAGLLASKPRTAVGSRREKRCRKRRTSG